MVRKLVALALESPLFAVTILLVVLGGGGWAVSELDVEAYPNPVPPMVEVVTQPEGWSAEETERHVTIPLELALAGMNGLDHVRSQSLFGLSDVKCYFRWGTDYDAARQEVLNRLQQAELPQGVSPGLSPWNAVGEVLRYTVEGDGYSQTELKTAEDWILERQLKRADGVVDVSSFGGLTKRYQVGVDPMRLRGHDVTLAQLLAAIPSANRNVGGQRLSLGEQSYDVRGVGLLRSVHDVEDIVVASPKGTPVRVKDVAQVRIGAAPRLGIIGKDDDADVVQGIVRMRYGGDTEKTLDAVHRRLTWIKENHVLPPGMQVRVYYDRGDLTRTTKKTVGENVVLGIVLVSAVLFVFLGNARAAAVTALTIPLALLVAVLGLVLSKTSANLISIGAVDFGIVVDSTVIVIENVFRHLGHDGKGTARERVLAAVTEVAAPMTFSALIIGTSFLPLFTMTGVAGVIFSPLARTYAFAIGGAMLLAITVAPFLASRTLRVGEGETESRLVRVLHRVYGPLFDRTLRRPKTWVAVCVVLVGASLASLPLVGSEFMPKLEEGNLWIRATLPASISLEQSAKYVGRMRALVRGCPPDGGACDHPKHPEVLSAVSQLGRPDDGTDVSGFSNVEIFAPLAPMDQWPRGRTKEQLTDELSKELEDAFPGVVFNFSQAIRDNVEEAVAGVKGENSVKVFGPELDDNERTADAIEAAMSGVRGVRDLGVLRTMGQPNVRITPDRKACAAYGLNTGDVTSVIGAAVGGVAVTKVYEGEKSFDLVVRWLPEYRGSIEAIREITVPTPDGASVPLGQIAGVELVSGPTTIYREDGERYTPLKFSVRGRDLGGTVTEAQHRVDAEVHKGWGQHLEWSGEEGELREAQRRIAIVLPITLFLVTLLVHAAVKTWADTLVVLFNVPVACAGGVIALLVTRTTFSVSAGMGFVSVLGIAVQDAILVVTFFQRLRAEGLDPVRAAREAAEKRLRAALMTTLVATLGLLPAALSDGIGAQAQKPLAIVVIGGSLVLAVIARAVQPPLLALVHGWMDRRAVSRAPAAA